MNILIDINHPAHVHFFRNAINILKNKGHKVIITSRKKEVTTELLDLYNIKHICLSTAKPGIIRLGLEMLKREYQLISIIKKENIDICASITGACTSHIAKLFRIPSLVFYDTEHAKLQNTLSIPFATKYFTPDCYFNPPVKNQELYSGTHELAYLHPKYFTPDSSLLKKLGISSENPYTIIRFVSWNAAHDKGEKGLDTSVKIKLVQQLAQHVSVFITSEDPLPEEIKQYKIEIPAHYIHHALAFASFYIGESPTMASEAACLGTPSIYISPYKRGYIEKLTQKYGLIFNVKTPETLLDTALSILNGRDSQKWKLKANQLIEDHIDVTAFVVKNILTYGQKII